MDSSILDALLDSWERNNTILVNLLRALPEGSLDDRPMAGSPSIAQLFAHMHFVRLVFVAEDAPEFAHDLPANEWDVLHDRDAMARMLNESATVVRDAVKSRVERQQAMDLHYDTPILLLQHMIWHEGYHHGQIKIALKLRGHMLSDDVAGPISWHVWMDKTRGS